MSDRLTPPVHLLPEYDPKSSKVAQLRGILLQYDVRQILTKTLRQTAQSN